MKFAAVKFDSHHCITYNDNRFVFVAECKISIQMPIGSINVHCQLRVVRQGAVLLSSLVLLQKNNVQMFKVGGRVFFTIVNIRLIKINNSHEEHGHARLQMSSITRPGLIAN